jgi:hypothetical protein
MPNRMLEYSKLILEKVSFDPKLFTKEYRKAYNVLNESDRTALYAWCKNRFGPEFRLVA